MDTREAAFSIGGISPPRDRMTEHNGAIDDQLPPYMQNSSVGATTTARCQDPDPCECLWGPLELDISNPRFRAIDLMKVEGVIQNFNVSRQLVRESSQCQRLEWPLSQDATPFTPLDLEPAFNALDERTSEFILERDLMMGIFWLRSAAPFFFEGADFEVELLPAEDGEDNMLALRVYSAYGAKDFRERRHLICEAMQDACHTPLYDVISVFQRRVNSSGLQALSWYSTISAE